MMTYYCTIEQEAEGYVVTFPDLPNIITGGSTKDEALAMAEDALNGCLEASLSNELTIDEVRFTKGHAVHVASHIAVALQLRKLRGNKSQSEIAKRLGLSYQAYQKLENPRKANPTVKTLEKIARIYGRELIINI
jgi:antitoxin HicB